MLPCYTRTLFRRNLDFTAKPLCLTLLFSLSLFALNPTASIAQERTAVTQSWTDSTGKKSIEAEFVKLDGVQLVLRKSDGKELTIPLYKLDDKSRLRARSIAKYGTAGPLSVAPSPPVEFPANPTAIEFKDIVARELKNKNPMVLWDMLPANKQKQVDTLVKLASTRVEQRTLNLVKDFRKTLLDALASKKQFILNSKLLPLPPDQRQILEKSYEPLVGMIESMVPTELLDVQYLQESKAREIVAKYIADLVAKSNELERTIPADGPIRAMNIPIPEDFKIENVSASEVLVTPIHNGQASNDPSMAKKFVLSEGRWLPAELLQSWDQTMAQATQAIQAADPKTIHKLVSQGILGANLGLGAFSTAETQKDFDEALEQIMGMAQAMSGAMPGGARGPGSGSPGPGPSGPGQDRPRKPGLGASSN